MSFVEKFRVPYAESQLWDREQGQPQLARLGLCGQIIPDRGREYQRRLQSLAVNLSRITSEESQWLIQEVRENQQFTASVCVRERGHSGPCKKDPYIPRLIEGEVLKGPWAHEGADPNPLQNRGGSRNGLIQLDAQTVSEIRQQNKQMGVKAENCNLGINLNKGASKYMSALAHLDMISIAYHIEGAEPLFDSVPDQYKQIMDQRWRELKDHYYQHQIRIFDDQDHYQDPFTFKTVRLTQFGTREPLLERMQFGHVTPVNEQRWETRPFNVLPLTRWSNLMQSSASVPETMQMIQRMGDCYRREFGDLC